MRLDVRLQVGDVINRSHQGHRDPVTLVFSGARGRPRKDIDPEFLYWAYGRTSTQRIANFLGISRTTLRERLLALGLAERQLNPFDIASGDITSYTRLVSNISDEELDEQIMGVRTNNVRQGVTFTEGVLESMGLRVSRERIRQSLSRIEPGGRPFDRVRIKRRSYSVPGPNAVWHHDGQHGKYMTLVYHEMQLHIYSGLIRWGIVIHGFVDGYSRLITGMQAANNNRGETVLRLFHRAARNYGVPIRLRGDHGTENILVAAWLERFRGPGRGAYIWGR